VRGLEVSPGSLGQYELVQGEIGNSPAKTLVLLLKPLQLFKLIRPHTAILLAPAVIRLLGNLHLTDRVNASLPLPDKYINLP
jgi:hypothetical protein